MEHEFDDAVFNGDATRGGGIADDENEGGEQDATDDEPENFRSEETGDAFFGRGDMGGDLI